MTNQSSDCNFFPDEPWKCDTIIAFQRAAAALSLIGCLLAISIIWLFRRYTVVQQRMILFIAVSGAGGAIANIMGESEVTSFCKIIAFINTFFDWSMLLWVLTVAIHVHLTIFWKKSLSKKEILLHCIIWPLSLIISLLPFFSNKYGDSGAWCWIVHDTGWRMGIWYAPLFFIVVVLFVLYISGIIKMRSMISAWATFSPVVEENKERLRHEVKPLIFYPLVYVVVYITPLINRIQNAIAPDYPIYTLVILATISAASLGAVNSIIYSLDGETKKILRKDSIKTAWYSHITPTVKMGEYDTNSYDNPISKPEDRRSIANAKQLPVSSTTGERMPPGGVHNSVFEMEGDFKLEDKKSPPLAESMPFPPATTETAPSGADNSVFKMEAPKPENKEMLSNAKERASLSQSVTNERALPVVVYSTLKMAAENHVNEQNDIQSSNTHMEHNSNESVL